MRQAFYLSSWCNLIVCQFEQLAYKKTCVHQQMSKPVFFPSQTVWYQFADPAGTEGLGLVGLDEKPELTTSIRGADGGRRPSGCAITLPSRQRETKNRS